MTKFEEEFNYLIELSGKVLLGQVDAETFKKTELHFLKSMKQTNSKPCHSCLKMLLSGLSIARVWDMV